MDNKNTLKDIIMICKGYYDKDKYKNTMNALYAYYEQYFGSSASKLDKKFVILKILITRCMYEITQEKYSKELLILYARICVPKLIQVAQSSIHTDIETINVYVNYFNNLPLIYIDLSEYDHDKNAVLDREVINEIL